MSTQDSIILLALKSAGPFDPRDEAIVTMHWAFTHVNALLFCTAILYSAYGPIARMYAYPLRTSAIVAWRMLPAMLIIAVQSMVTTLVLNVLFQVEWPLLGPALFLAVVIAWANAICWVMEKSLGWQIFFLTAVTVILSIWLQTHYSEATSSRRGLIHYWDDVTVGDAFTMIAFAVAAYCVAVVGVARNRCGEPTFSLGVLNWMSRKFSARRVAARRSGTAAQTYFRVEWQRKGWVMPVSVLFGVTSFVLGWLLLKRDPDALVLGFLVGGTWLTLAGVLGGMVMGNTGRSDSVYAMRQFTAALPISDQEMARITLRMTATSVLVAWLVWAVALSVIYAILFVTGAAAEVKYPNGFIWWLYIPGTLLETWCSAAAVTAMGLSGRGKFWLKTVVAFFATVIFTVAISRVFLTPANADLVFRIIFHAVLLTVTVATLGFFVVAHHCRLIGPELTSLIAGAGVFIAVFVFLVWPGGLRAYWYAEVVFFPPYALAAAPLATFPLAIAANRHR